MVAHFWWATWAIRSHGSFLVSDLSDALTSLIKKEGMSKLLVFILLQETPQKYNFSQVFLAMSKWANSQLLFERSEWMSKWALSEFSALNFLQVGVRPTGPGAGHWGCWGSHPCPCPGGQDLCGGGLLDQWLHSTGACLLYILYIHYFHNLCYCSLISNVNVLYVNFFLFVKNIK